MRNGKLFSVVRFTELPFKDIAKNVCVPHSWIIIRTKCEKAAIAYPDKEDPLTTRNRVKRKEKYNDKWRFYMAAIEYDFDTFEDADNWIKARNGKNMTDSQPGSIPSMPFQLKLKNMDTERVKLDQIANPVGGIVNHPRTVSEHLKEKQAITVVDNQLIQSAQTGIAAALNDKTSSKHTLPNFIDGDRPVTSDQSTSPKLPHMNQPSPAGQIGEQALSLTDPDTAFDEDDHENDVADHVQFEPFEEDAIFPGKTPANYPEQVPQAASVNERPTPLVHHKHSLPELRLQHVPARQSKEADEIFLPSTSATHQNPRLQGTNGSSSTEVTHNDQRPSFQGLINNTPSPAYYLTNLMNPTSRFLHPSIKKKSSSATENPVAKKICLENITRNSIVKPAQRLTQKYLEEASRQPISNARSDFGATAIDLSISQQGVTKSAARSLSYLAQHSRSLVEPLNMQHNLLMRKHYLEHIAYVNYSTYLHAHVPGAMNTEFTLQSKPNPFGQTNLLLSQHNNQYGLLNENSMQEVLRHEIPRKLIVGAHTNSEAITPNYGSVIQFPTQNLLIQSHYNFENRQQTLDPPRYQDLPGHSLKSKADPQKTERQGVIERTRSPALPKTPSQPLLNAQQGYLLRDPRLRVKLNQNPTEHQILDPVVSENLVDQVQPTMVNAKVQTSPIPNRLDEAPSILLPEMGIVYQNPRTKKLVVDQATEMDPVMDADHCEDEASSSSDKSVLQVADSGRQTDECFGEEQDLSYQVADSESEISTHDVVLDRGECEDHPPADTVSESRSTSPQSPQMQQRLAAEQKMLNMYVLNSCFSQMGASLHQSRDLFNHLRRSMIKCADLYELLLEDIKKFNETEQLQISMPLPSNETSRASKDNISENSSAENITDISSAPKMNNSQKNTLVLPPEYDPNNPKWTRKYQKKSKDSSSSYPRLMFT